MTNSQNTASKIGIYWFRHDLRLSDNPTLHALCQCCDEVVFVYVKHRHDALENQFGLLPVGEHRQRFIDQSLRALDQSLKPFNQRLFVIEGEPVNAIYQLAEQLNATHLGVSFHCGFDEQQHVKQILARVTDVKLVSEHSSTLYRPDALPFAIDDMPDVYTQFRKKVEARATVSDPVDGPAQLPPCPNSMNEMESAEVNCATEDKDLFCGGESAGVTHLNTYFSGHAPQTYKLTRNALDEWEASTKFSPWLACGCLSPRQIWRAVDEYEQNVVANDSTYWIKFELLWREFFHWNACKHQSQWFQFSGIQRRPPTTQFNQARFEKWCAGETGYDIVDACMKQLNQTGYMSNRGRQLVASCFVHELALDWRYGAAYFEQQLIDYDVASNWGNWQYLAGVGSDPRGHRQFNLNKQSEMYDPQGTFIKQWLNK